MAASIRVAAAALAAAVILGVLAALLVPLAGPEARPEPARDDPAAYQVAEVLEEARRITREAAP